MTLWFLLSGIRKGESNFSGESEIQIGMCVSLKSLRTNKPYVFHLRLGSGGEEVWGITDLIISYITYILHHLQLGM